MSERWIRKPREYILDSMGGPIDSKLEVCIIKYDIRRFTTKLERNILQV